MSSSTTNITISNTALGMIGAKRIASLAEATEEARVVNNIYEAMRDEVLCEYGWSFAQKRLALVDITRTDQDAWVTATAYAVDDIILAADGLYYKCLIAHTSGVFATDLAAVDWVLYTSWVTGTAYAIETKVYNVGIEYSCLVNHTASALFATDLASVYWVATDLIVETNDGTDYVYYLPTDLLRINLISDANAIVKLEGTFRLLSDTGDLTMIYTYANNDPTSYSGQFITALATRIAAEVCFNLTQSMSKAQTIMEKYNTMDLPRATAADSTQSTPMEGRQDLWEWSRISGDGGYGYVKPNSATWHPLS